eukprot:TRINITY_DN779_c0_g1_i3.p1 TRINITY_DN779_c0_g1~~TRINITY_DN779_c0_g1_i3.p1  ORF type:complete len:530 (+),score=81.85 TRINITY_DN779_c0_g1_i3:800-2389(+)
MSNQGLFQSTEPGLSTGGFTQGGNHVVQPQYPYPGSAVPTPPPSTPMYHSAPGPEQHYYPVQPLRHSSGEPQYNNSPVVDPRYQQQAYPQHPQYYSPQMHHSAPGYDQHQGLSLPAHYSPQHHNSPVVDPRYQQQYSAYGVPPGYNNMTGAQAGYPPMALAAQQYPVRPNSLPTPPLNKGKVFLRVIRCNGLTVADWTSSDPHVRIDYKNEDHTAKDKTRIIRRSLNPIFEEEFLFPVKNANADIEIRFSVFSKDAIKGETFMGEAKTIFKTLAAMTGEEQVLSLSVKGTITVSFLYYPCQLPEPSMGNKCIVYPHSFTHMLREGNIAKKGEGFPVYKITMRDVARFLTVRQGWNRDYDAAKKIFTSSTIQAVIKVQHQSLYSSSNKKQGTLYTGDDFLAIIRYGIVGGYRRFFTYCLLDDELNFAETGKTTAKDFTSKHAMHSCAKDEVRYAGEFHVREEKGRHTLVVDNNSGTYAPPKERLPSVKELFEYNFPGLKVEFVHWADEKLKTYQKEVADQNLRMDGAMKK